MNIAAAEHRYYLRSGSSSLAMESFMVADRFRRKRQPDLELSYRLTDGGTSGVVRVINLTASIVNTGRATAIYPACRLRVPNIVAPSPFGLDGNYGTGLRLVPTPPLVGAMRDYMYAGGGDVVIYPGTAHDFMTFTIPMPDVPSSAWPIRLQYELYAIDAEKTGEVTISVDEMMRVYGVE